MKNLSSFDNFEVNESKVNPKKGYTISTKVQDSIKKLCEGKLHDEAMAHDKSDDKSQTYEGYMKHAGKFMNQCMNECMEVYRGSATTAAGMK